MSAFDELFHRGLSLEKLRAFLEVARTESVTVAAKGEPSRRSLMSRQIGELEQTLGLELFTRRGKSLQITEAGRELALVTAAYFSEFEATVGRFRNSRESLRLGGGASVFEALLFPQQASLEQAFPGHVFEFVPTSTEYAVRKLHEGEIDLGVLRSGLHDTGLIEIPACSLSFCIVGRRDFDRKMDQWTLAEFFRRVPMVVIRGQGQWLGALQRLCDKLEVEPRWSHRVETFGHVRELLRSGASGGVLPVQMVHELDASQYLVVEDPALESLKRQLSVVYDTRAAKVRERLGAQAAQLAVLLRAESA